MIQTIEITVRGGIIQDIDNIPYNIRIKVIDYDNDENDQISIWK